LNGLAIQNLEAGAAKQPRPKLHEIKPREPKTGSREAAGGQGATLMMAAVGALFLAYVFNFRGFETSVDAYFSGLDAAVKGHNSQVARIFVNVLPLAGGLLAAGLLWVFGNTLGRVAKGVANPKKAKAKAKQAEAPAAPPVDVTVKKPVAKAPAVCVKPLRLDRVDRGVTRIILTRR
jgi:hypothetical protein